MTPEEEFQKDLNNILFENEKKFADNIKLFFAQGYFSLFVKTGNTSQTFALTPHMVKKVMRIFVAQMKSYEDSFGVVNVDSSVPSPIQASDLNNPDSPESAPPDIPKKPKKK